MIWSVLRPWRKWKKEDSSRFDFTNVMTELDVKSLADKRIPKNTLKNMKWSTNISRNNFFSKKFKGEEGALSLLPTTPLEEMAPEELNEVVPLFISECRKQNGERYPGNSLWQLVVNLQAYIRMKEQYFSLLGDVQFKPIADSLDVHMKQASLEGLGHKVQADTVSVDVEKKGKMEF